MPAATVPLHSCPSIGAWIAPGHFTTSLSRSSRSGARQPALFRRDGAYHDLLFGFSRDAEADSGTIVFHDAWITPDTVPGCLCQDVMTPHHPKWQNNEAAPTDFDSPIPVSFLSVNGTFRVGVSWAGPANHPQAANWTELAFSLLKEALREWGVGGKTSSGYGRLVVPPPPSPPPPPKLSDKATVTVLERRDMGGKATFRLSVPC